MGKYGNNQERNEECRLKYLGAKNISSNGESMEIIRYNNSNDIDVLFDSGYISKNKTISDFEKGKIKNPYSLTIYGVGYIGEGKYKCRIDTVYQKSYETWRSMIDRCYNKRKDGQNDSYYGIVEVCKEWHNYQNFAEWYYENYYSVGEESMCLDKDTVCRDNKIYSPETCVFLPKKLNVAFIKISQDEFWINEINSSRTKGFSCQITLNGKPKYLGIFDTKEELIKHKNTIRREHLLGLVSEYEEKIPAHITEKLRICVDSYLT